MPDSKTTDNNTISDNFTDDLDAMLSDVESIAVPQPELINDDVIDQLLMDEDIFDLDDHSTDQASESTIENIMTATEGFENSEDELDIEHLMQSLESTDSTVPESELPGAETNIEENVVEEPAVEPVGDLMDEVISDVPPELPVEENNPEEDITEEPTVEPAADLMDEVISDVPPELPVEENNPEENITEKPTVEPAADLMDEVISDVPPELPVEENNPEENITEEPTVEPAVDLMDEVISDVPPELPVEENNPEENITEEPTVDPAVDLMDEVISNIPPELPVEENNPEENIIEEPTVDPAVDLMDEIMAEASPELPVEKSNIEENVEETTDSNLAEQNIDHLLTQVVSDIDGDNMVDTNELAEDDSVTDKSKETSSEDHNIDDLIDSVALETDEQEDEFTEIDSFSEQDHESQQTDGDGDDFLIGDFDISADDDLATHSEQDDLFPPDITHVEEDTELSSVPQADHSKEITEIQGQVSQLWSENEALKQQVSDVNQLITVQKSSSLEEIEELQKEQRKFKKLLRESEEKVPVVTYVAMGIAILALLVGGGLGFIGYNAQTDVTALSELVTSLEEEQELQAAKDPTDKIKKINRQLAAIKDQNKQFNQQLDKIHQALKTNSLQTVVDRLSEQSQQSQKAIEDLFTKLEALEKSKLKSKTVKTTHRTKKVAPPVKWVINLISFRQLWYAKRKSTEFEKKGIPVKIKKTKIDGVDWYRLTTKGFKRKSSAQAYANKIKSTLNLTSVWVTKDK